MLLSVAAIRKRHKRIDYVIEETARLPHPRPFLLLLGQRERETPELEALAERLLGRDNYGIRTVPHREIDAYYQAADAFVLASFQEGLSGALVEALAHGLPCLAHDYALTRDTLGGFGRVADLSQAGALAALMRDALDAPPDPDAQRRQHQAAYERFSWDRLKPRYIEMLQKCARLPPKT